MSERARLRWLCRRGTRELDLMLSRYLDQAWEHESEGRRRAFERLLQMQDPELFALLTGRADAPDAELADVVARIRATASD